MSEPLFCGNVLSEFIFVVSLQMVRVRGLEKVPHLFLVMVEESGREVRLESVAKHMSYNFTEIGT